MTRTEFVVHQNGVVRERVDDEPANPHMLLFGLEGELFFGSTIALDEHLTWFEKRAAEGAKVLVLRVKHLRNPDAVGMREIDAFIGRMHEMGVRGHSRGGAPRSARRAAPPVRSTGSAPTRSSPSGRSGDPARWKPWLPRTPTSRRSTWAARSRLPCHA